ncbi:hypothetical protein Hanom_Chr08g00720411 [Helianthus anomalus]
MNYSEKPIEQRAFDSLGLGFDFASGFRLKFKRDIVLPVCGVTVSGVSVDIHCDKGEHVRFKSDVLKFNQLWS